MRLPRLRVRFRLWMLIVAVAMVAVALGAGIGLQRRKARFERLFSYHRGLAGPAYRRSFDPGRPIFHTAKGRWHWDLSIKYAEAARRPWLPVAPDPPEPE